MRIGGAQVRGGASGRRRAWAPAALLALLALLVSGARPARAQSRVVVLPAPHTPVVALALDVNAGAAWEQAAEAGASLLAARAALEGVRPTLDALGATASVECGRAALRVRLLAPPSTWVLAAELLFDALLQPRIEPGAFERARSELLRGLRFAEGDPALEVRAVLHQALFGTESPWARDGCGRPGSIDSLDVQTVQRTAQRRFTPTRMTAAVLGPVHRAEADSLVRARLGDVGLPILLPVPRTPPIAGTRTIESPTVTAFVGMAFPLAARLDDEALRLLAFRVLDAVRPSAARPDIFDAAARVERFGGGGLLVVYLVTSPESARRWTATVRDEVRAMADAPAEAGAFGRLLRRYRGERLLSVETPEARAGEAADRLFFDQAYTALEARIDALTPARLRRAALELGEPAVAVLGPALEPAGAGPDPVDHLPSHR